jgi:catechol 2,3-dioxygenase-like lactoylglutathione lyase family enzyme
MASMLSRVTVGQIGIVVKDLDAAVESYWRTAGIGPWNIYTTGAPPLRCTYHGHPASYQVQLATTMSGQVQMELIEYISGDTIHRDFLASGREGVEHFGIYVPDLERALQPYLDKGIRILQQADGMGVKGDGRYAYLDTESILGTILELIQSSSQPTPPERISPVI